MIEQSIVHLPELVKDIDRPVSNYLVHLSSHSAYYTCVKPDRLTPANIGRNCIRKPMGAKSTSSGVRYCSGQHLGTGVGHNIALEQSRVSVSKLYFAGRGLEGCGFGLLTASRGRIVGSTSASAASMLSWRIYIERSRRVS